MTASWLSALAAFAVALRELVRLVAGAAERRRRREDAAKDAKASGYDKFFRATRVRQAVRERLAATRATGCKADPIGDGGNTPADGPPADGLSIGFEGDKYRRD